MEPEALIQSRNLLDDEVPMVPSSFRTRNRAPVPKTSLKPALTAKREHSSSKIAVVQTHSMLKVRFGEPHCDTASISGTANRPSGTGMKDVAVRAAEMGK